MPLRDEQSRSSHIEPTHQVLYRVCTCVYIHTCLQIHPPCSLVIAHHYALVQPLLFHELDLTPQRDRVPGSVTLTQHPADSFGLRLHAWAGAGLYLTVQN